MSFLQDILSTAGNALLGLADLLAKHTQSRIAREVFFKGVHDYQSSVYPNPNSTFFNLRTQWLPVYSNLESEIWLYISSWNITYYTANATGCPPPVEDSGFFETGFDYYDTPVQLHGYHALVVETAGTRENESIIFFQQFLSGLEFYQTLFPTKHDNINNEFTNKDHILVWLSPFLVIPANEAYVDDITQNYGTKAIILPPETVLYSTLRADSRFYLPDGTSNNPDIPAPVWLSNKSVVLNYVFLFVGKILPGSDTGLPVEGVGSGGSPTETWNKEVVTELVLLKATSLG